MTCHTEQKQLGMPLEAASLSSKLVVPGNTKHALREASKQKNKWQQGIFKSETLQQLAEIAKTVQLEFSGQSSWRKISLHEWASDFSEFLPQGLNFPSVI